MSDYRARQIQLEQFTCAFVPFALLLAWALLQPETSEALDLNRTKLTIWATAILLCPALVLYLFRSLNQTVANLAHLYWTIAWLTFVFHAYWAVFIIFDGVADTFVQQGRLIASVNFLLLGWWSVDVALLWTLPATAPLLRYSQIAVRILSFLIFAITLVALRGGAVFILGVFFLAIVTVAVLVRLGTHVSVVDKKETAS